MNLGSILDSLMANQRNQGSFGGRPGQPGMGGGMQGGMGDLASRIPGGMGGKGRHARPQWVTISRAARSPLAAAPVISACAR